MRQARPWRTTYSNRSEVRHRATHLLFLTKYSPHHKRVTAERLPQVYYALERLNIETGAFAQLTRKYMTETFNPNTPDVADVRYVPLSFGLFRSAEVFRR